MTFTATAICAFVSLDRAMTLYSPSPRHVALCVAHGVVVPKVNLGSNAQAIHGATGAGAATICEEPEPPRGANSSDGLIVDWDRLCTTIVLTKRSDPTFFAAYGPYAVCAPVVTPF